MLSVVAADPRFLIIKVQSIVGLNQISLKLFGIPWPLPYPIGLMTGRNCCLQMPVVASEIALINILAIMMLRPQNSRVKRSATLLSPNFCLFLLPLHLAILARQGRGVIQMANGQGIM